MKHVILTTLETKVNIPIGEAHNKMMIQKELEPFCQFPQ